MVAPCMGAWIETHISLFSYLDKMSHPVWVRGLKQGGTAMTVLTLSRTLYGCVD